MGDDESSCYVLDIEKYNDLHYAREKLDKLNLLDLIKRFSKSADDETGDIINQKDYWNCLTAIRNLLCVVTAEEINKAHRGILAKIDKLEARFRNHRHDYSKTFTGRAEY